MIERALPVDPRHDDPLPRRRGPHRVRAGGAVRTAPPSDDPGVTMLSTSLVAELPDPRPRHRRPLPRDRRPVPRAARIPGSPVRSAPAGVRGLVLHRGKQGVPTTIPATHRAYFDWTYPSDQPEMRELYRRAKAGQWDGETLLAWKTSRRSA